MFNDSDMFNDCEICDICEKLDKCEKCEICENVATVKKKSKEIQQCGMPDSSKEWYSTGDAAKSCCVSIRTIERWCRDGFIKHSRNRFTRITKIPKDELMRILPKIEELKELEKQEECDNADKGDKKEVDNMPIKEKKKSEIEKEIDSDIEKSLDAADEFDKKRPKNATEKIHEQVEKDELDAIVDE